jgi:hypothetical protein
VFVRVDAALPVLLQQTCLAGIIWLPLPRTMPHDCSMFLHSPCSPSPLSHYHLPSLPPQVHFVMGADFRVEDLLKLQLHKYSEDVAEIVDRAQKEEKMETVS